MINRLIDMKPNVTEPIKDTVLMMDKNSYTVTDYANAFLQGMGETQRNRFKRMLQNGIDCGMSVAEVYGVDYKEFIIEVRKLLGLEE